MDAEDQTAELNTHTSHPAARSKPDGDLNPAAEAGWYLQREREKRGLSLDQISEATGIHPYHVEAIEKGDLTRLPQRLEALEMIGIYGEYMGFEPEPLVMHYAVFLPRPQAAQGQPQTLGGGKLGAGASQVGLAQRPQPAAELVVAVDQQRAELVGGLGAGLDRAAAGHH